jgi:HEAT repeat protein
LALALGMPAFAGDPPPAKSEKQIEEEERRKAEREAEQAAKDRIAEFNKSLKGVKSTSVVAGAIRGLAEVKHRLIVQKLVQLLNGPGDDAIHTAAVEALGQIGDPSCVPALNAALLMRLPKATEQASVCSALCRAIGGFRDPRGTPGLVQALNCRDVGVMGAACEAAGSVPDPILVEELIGLLKEASVPDATLYDPRGQQYGSRTIENRRKGLREPAQKSLGRLTGQSFGSPREWQDWWQANRARWRPPGGGR